MAEKREGVGEMVSAPRVVTTPVSRPRPLWRTPQSVSKKVGAKFKSPVPAKRGPAYGSEEALRREMDAVRSRTVAVDHEIAGLTAQGCSTDELDIHIQKMHEYNELKDAGQSLLGQLAVLRSVTTRDLYGEYGLDLED